MTKYTTPHSLPLIEPATDMIRSANGDNLWKQLNALALATGNAITAEGERVAAGTEEKYGTLPPRVEDVEEKNAEQDARFGELEAATPTIVDTEEFVAVAVDSEERRTWIEYRASDGGPTSWALSHLESSLGVALSETSGSEEWPALVDSNGVYTDLVVRSTDGRIPDRIINDWKARMGVSAGVTFYERDGELRESDARSSLSIWGSSTLDAAGPHFAAYAQRKGVPFYGGGLSGNWTQHVMARLGVTPAEITFPGNVIPSSADPVPVVANNLPVFQFPAYPVMVGGVAGRLSGTHQGTWSFTRSSSGPEVAVPPRVQALVELGAEHRADTFILNAGKNNLSHSGTVADVIAHNKRIVDWLAPQRKRVIIAGDFVDTGTAADSPVRAKIYEANALRKAWAGPAYIDSHAFVTGQDIWAATGITPTPADLAEQALGNKPPSVSRDNGHFNEAGLAAWTELITRKMETLGWY